MSFPSFIGLFFLIAVLGVIGIWLLDKLLK
jgi:hypothetical protein